MDKKLYRDYPRIVETHWWYRGRAKIIRSVLNRFVLIKRNQLLDVGAGPGSNIGILKDFAENITALEPDQELLRVGKQLHPDTYFIHGEFPIDAPQKTFDVISLFDVLEHIKDDESALGAAHDLLTKEGMLVVTVPAYMFLWSEHDEIAHHFRRYTHKELRKRLESAGFRIEYISYFNTLLFLPIIFVRVLKKMVRIRTKRSDFSLTTGFFNTALGQLFSLEASVLSKISLPFGVSLIAIVKKDG